VEVVRVHADVELGQVEAEELDAPAQSRQPPVRDPGTAVRAEALVEKLEVGRKRGRGGVARVGSAL
jgi:hypothetical protein